MPHAITRTTPVRMAVARWELTPTMPILARMDVNAAKTTDRTAKKSHTAKHAAFPQEVGMTLDLFAQRSFESRV